MKVLVTDGDNRAALAITRSLGRAGHHVVVGEKHSPSLARTSRYCAGGLVYPDPARASDEFVAFLADAVRAQGIDVLMPVADITTLLITRHRDAFGRCAIPFASADTLERAADKVDVVQTAMRLGVPVPRSVVVNCPDRVPEHDLPFPLVIKPARSRIRTSRGWVSTSVSFAGSEAELRRDLASRPAHEFPVMLQERIVGPGKGVFAYYHGGRPVALFSHKRIREKPPWGGVAVLSESIAVDPEAQKHALRLLDELQWDGVAMVEFKEDVRDGTPKLMEINGRYWGSLQLAIDAGVDFPAMLVRGVRGDLEEPQQPYRIGVRNRWLWGDVDSLLATLFGQIPGRGAERAGRTAALVDFARFWAPGLHYENPKSDDLRPWLFESRRWFQSVGRSIASHFASRSRTVPISPEPRDASLD